MPTSAPTAGRTRWGPLPRWVVLLGSVGVALGMLVGFRQRRLDSATRALHERHGPPPGTPSA